mmetsp:Transcript_45118/g.118341  ORF Transcript_45118/g.118341 Transcript_45118/m.118341 type:complete len:350 (+) Transcript_45118:70-1119(+)
MELPSPTSTFSIRSTYSDPIAVGRDAHDCVFCGQIWRSSAEVAPRDYQVVLNEHATVVFDGVVQPTYRSLRAYVSSSQRRTALSTAWSKLPSGSTPRPMPHSSHPRARVETQALEAAGDELVRLAPCDYLRLVLSHWDDGVLPPVERQAAVPPKLVRCLQAGDEGALLAQALCAVLALAHTHPVARADQVRDGRLERRPLAVRARREPSHGARVARDVRIDHLRGTELGDSRGEQLVHEQADDVFLCQRQQGAGVVEVARHHGALRRVVAPEQLRLLPLQLVEHEEGTARATQRREAGEDVRRRARRHGLVEPQAHGDHIDTVHGGGGAELGRAARDSGGAAHDGFHAL